MFSNTQMIQPGHLSLASSSLETGTGTQRNILRPAAPSFASGVQSLAESNSTPTIRPRGDQGLTTPPSLLLQ